MPLARMISKKTRFLFKNSSNFVFTLGQMGEKITAQITELQKTKEKYHTLFETSNDAVFGHGRGGLP